MAALPYMPLFVSDYLADTAHLNTREHGAYLLLIMNYWQREGPLPGDDKRLAAIVKLTHGEWLTVKPEIQSFFIEHSDGKANALRWHHERIDHELKIARGKSSKARASANARWSKDNNAVALPTHSERNATIQDKARKNSSSSDKTAVQISPNDPHLNGSLPIEIRELYTDAELDVLRFENDLVQVDVELVGLWDWILKEGEKVPSSQKRMISGAIQNKQKKAALVKETLISKRARREAGDNGDGPAGVSSALLSSKLMQGARA